MIRRCQHFVNTYHKIWSQPYTVQMFALMREKKWMRIVSRANRCKQWWTSSSIHSNIRFAYIFHSLFHSYPDDSRRYDELQNEKKKTFLTAVAMILGFYWHFVTWTMNSSLFGNRRIFFICFRFCCTDDIACNLQSAVYSFKWIVQWTELIRQSGIDRNFTCYSYRSSSI